MDKKINFGVALAIIILVAVAGGFIYFKTVGDEQALLDYGKRSNKSDVQSFKDSIKVSRADGSYEIDVASKKMKPLNDRLLDLSLFKGLPEKTDEVLNNIVALNPDRSKALVASTVLDKSSESKEFDGSIPVSSASEFLCDTIDKTCEPSDILKSAYAGIGGKDEWFNNDQIIKWHGLNTNRGIIYGCSIGSNGGVSPVYAYDYSGNSLQKSSNFESSEAIDKKADIPYGAFSPSLNKFATIYHFSDKWYLYLYDGANISEPLKKIDITLAKDDLDEDNEVDSVAWSPDEKTLALATDTQIYTLNLDNEELNLRYTDMVAEENTADIFEQGMDSSSVKFSSGGNYVVFVDYDTESVVPDGKKFNTVLKAVDLSNDDNDIIDLLKEENLSLE